MLAYSIFVAAFALDSTQLYLNTLLLAYVSISVSSRTSSIAVTDTALRYTAPDDVLHLDLDTAV